MTFTEITKALKDVSKIASTNERVDYLKTHDDKDFKEVLAWYLDSSRISGIAEKKYDKVNALVPELETQDIKQFSNVIRYLDCHRTGKDEDVAYVKYLGNCICKDEEELSTFRSLVCKNYPMGLRDALVNKAFPKLVPVYEVMLADKYYDLDEKKKTKIFANREFNLTTKLDGFRITIHKENGVVRCISRNGKLIEGLVDIEKDVQNMTADNFVLDGEVLIKDRSRFPSKLQYKETSKIVSAKNPEKHGVEVNVFDWVSSSIWKEQLDSETYSERYKSLKSTLEATNPENLKLVPLLYVGTDVSKIDSFLNEAKSNNEEGIMVRFSDSKYQWKRSKDLLKVKPFQEMDLVIKGYEEGTNANKGRLGAFICEVNHPQFGNIKVKVGGGYSEEERINFWKEKDNLIDRVISVQYFEVTNNEAGQYSIRFPEFLELKEEGQEINN